MHLVSLVDQVAAVNRHSIRFRAGESICTEHSNKFTVEGFEALARSAGMRPDGAWTDEEHLFAVLLLRTN